MKKIRLSSIRRAVLALLFAYVLFASISSDAGEWYARYLYPAISKFLSRFSSFVSFSLDEFAVIGMAFLLVAYPIYRWKYKGKKWISVLGGEIELLLWIYVWFYWGWGMNYYRFNFFQRAEVHPVAYDEVCFQQFLAAYTDSLKITFEMYEKEQGSSSVSKLAASRLLLVDQGVEATGVSVARIQNQIKEVFARVPANYGLALPESYQHPKCSSFNSLYSQVGVLGFMGPFFAESHVNHELSELEYPFTYAHELSHLLGISSEAEANFWAYTVCTQSDDSFIRFSGYFGLFSYVWSNARYLLSPDQFEEWKQSIPSEIVDAFYRVHAYWSMRYNQTLGEAQSVMYNFYLKRNRIAAGQKNYAQVIGLLLSLPNYQLELPMGS